MVNYTATLRRFFFFFDKPRKKRCPKHLMRTKLILSKESIRFHFTVYFVLHCKHIAAKAIKLTQKYCELFHFWHFLFFFNFFFFFWVGGVRKKNIERRLVQEGGSLNPIRKESTSHICTILPKD